MKKFNLLGVLAILVFVFATISSFMDAYNKTQERFKADAASETTTVQENTSESMPNRTLLVRVNISPEKINANKTTINDNTISGTVSQISTYIKPSLMTNLSLVPYIISALLYVYGIYLLIRAFISISNRDVFTRKNVWRIRFACYSSLAVTFFAAVQQWFMNNDILSQVVISGYKVLGRETSSFNWASIAIMILLAEIFAVSVKIKEEQDLTI